MCRLPITFHDAMYGESGNRKRNRTRSSLANSLNRLLVGCRVDQHTQYIALTRRHIDAIRILSPSHSLGLSKTRPHTPLPGISLQDENSRKFLLAYRADRAVSLPCPRIQRPINRSYWPGTVSPNHLIRM